jgi:chitosanase
MPGLKAIDARYESTGDDQGGTAELDAIGDWNADWAASANDEATRADFRACEDHIVDILYYGPAMQAARKWGLKSALSKAALYDMWINQGDDALIKTANAALGDKGQVAPVIGYHGITEDAWLKQFLIARRDLMWADDTWKQAVDRVAGYEKQRRHGNWDLSSTVRNDVHAADCWGATYTPSGYTVREISPDGTWTTPTSSSFSCE